MCSFGYDKLRTVQAAGVHDVWEEMGLEWLGEGCGCP